VNTIELSAVQLTAALVELDSRNPALVPGAPGERGVACFLADVLREWGFTVELADAATGRPNLIARAGRARPGAGVLMLNGHLDVVGTEGMAHAPFTPTVTQGRLYGRGSADMKSGIAAMCVAAKRAVERGIEGEVIIAAVVDEEYESLGTRALVASGVRADACVITEPTRLMICPAHRGFVWVRITVTGRAAHGSRYDLGVDAITQAAHIVAELDRIQRDVHPTRTHPLLGRASLHASTIAGGTGISTYPDRCVVEVERRTVPGESSATFRAEVDEAIAAVRRIYPALDAAVELTTAQGPSDVSLDAPITRALDAAIRATGREVRVEGMSAWTDAALLNDGGIPTVCFGPGDIGLAHAAEEYVPVAEIDAAVEVLEQLVSTWCNAPAPEASRDGASPRYTR
jgi:acetylornithine deacetylase